MQLTDCFAGRETQTAGVLTGSNGAVSLFHGACVAGENGKEQRSNSDHVVDITPPPPRLPGLGTAEARAAFSGGCWHMGEPG